MPFPSLAPPSNPRYDSAANSTLQFMTLYSGGQGLPADLVSLETNAPYNPRLLLPFSGNAQTSLGDFPEYGTDGFGDLMSQGVLRWKMGQLSLRAPGRGVSAAPATAITVASIFKIDLPVADQMFAAGTKNVGLGDSDGLTAGFGLALSLTENGVIRLAEKANNGVVTVINSVSGGPRVIRTDRWYCVALTALIASPYTRYLNVFDYTSQTADTEFNYTGSALVFSALLPDAVINQTLDNGHGVSFMGMKRADYIDKDSWAAGANSKFQSVYQDPAVWARAAAYTSASGTLEAGNLELVTTDSSSITLTLTRPKGGVWPVTAQLHRGDRPNFTPSAGAGGTALVGKTATFSSSAAPVATLSDTSPAFDTSYYYKVVYTDSAGSPVSVTSNTAVGHIRRGSIRLAILSETANQQPGFVPRLTESLGSKRWRSAAYLRAPAGASLLGAGKLGLRPGTFSLQWSGAVSTTGSFTLNPWGLGATSAINCSGLTTAAIQSALNGLAIPGIEWVVGGSPLSLSSDITVTSYGGPGVPSPWGNKTIAVTPTGFTAGATLGCSSNYGTFANWCLSQSYAAVLEVGFNDTAMSAEAFKSQVRAMAKDLLDSGVPVVYLVVSPPRSSFTETQAGSLIDFAAAIDSLDNRSRIISLGCPGRAYLDASQDRPFESAFTGSNSLPSVLAERLHMRLDPGAYNVRQGLYPNG